MKNSVVLNEGREEVEVCVLGTICILYVALRGSREND